MASGTRAPDGAAAHLPPIDVTSLSKLKRIGKAASDALEDDEFVRAFSSPGKGKKRRSRALTLPSDLCLKTPEEQVAWADTTVKLDSLLKNIGKRSPSVEKIELYARCLLKHIELKGEASLDPKYLIPLQREIDLRRTSSELRGRITALALSDKEQFGFLLGAVSPVDILRCVPLSELRTYIDSLTEEDVNDILAFTAGKRDKSDFIEFVSMYFDSFSERNRSEVLRISGFVHMSKREKNAFLDALIQEARVSLYEEKDFITLLGFAKNRYVDRTMEREIVLYRALFAKERCTLSFDERLMLMKTVNFAERGESTGDTEWLATMIVRHISKNLEAIDLDPVEKEKLADVVDYCARARGTPLELAKAALEDLAIKDVDDKGTFAPKIENLAISKRINLAWAAATYHANCWVDKEEEHLPIAREVVELAATSLMEQDREGEEKGLLLETETEVRSVLRAVASIPLPDHIEYFGKRYRHFLDAPGEPSRTAERIAISLRSGLRRMAIPEFAKTFILEAQLGPRVAFQHGDVYFGGRGLLHAALRENRTPPGLVVEVDGPTHFLRWGDDTLKTPKTNLRDRIYDAAGVKLIVHAVDEDEKELLSKVKTVLRASSRPSAGSPIRVASPGSASGGGGLLGF